MILIWLLYFLTAFVISLAFAILTKKKTLKIFIFAFIFGTLSGVWFVEPGNLNLAPIISILFYYYTDIFNIKILFISFITSLACQLGDLFFSYLKRKAKLKDTGNFLPGHGGVLDRLDGIYFGIPLGFIALILFF